MAGVVIVTGALGALGTAVIAKLRREEFSVVGIDLADGGDRPDVRGGIDLADEAAVGRSFAEIAAAHGPIAGLVNVAGGFVWQTVAGGDLAGWDRMYRMNLKSAAIACAKALPHLAPDASIVMIAAAAAQRPGTGMGAYAASKAGVIALMESLAEEIRGRGRVNAILPTIIDTPANRADMPDADHAQWVAPAAIADVVAFLLSPAAECVTGAAIRTR